jgi:plastocyanin
MKKISFGKNRFTTIVSLFLLIMSITISCKKSSDTPGPNEVFIKGMAFNPSTITVAAGTSVTWTNKDGVAHTVTSTGGLFDSGSINPGETYSHLFNTAGTFPYYCTIHTYMTGSVVVK